MKKNLIIMLSAAACTLVSCGNKLLPSITEEQAIELTKKMYQRHNDPSLFEKPNVLTVTIKSESSGESKTPSGHNKNSSKGETKHFFDLDNLYYKRYIKNEDATSSSETTHYCYFDNATGNLLTLNNSNGYKTRTEEKMNAEEAKKIIENSRSSFETFTTGNYMLSSFEYNLSQIKELHEKYKSETDQYVNYYLGSSNDKSFQYVTDVKQKYNNEYEEPKYEGYIQQYGSVIYENDLVTSYIISGSQDIKTKDNLFYQKLSSNQTATTTYGSCTIEKPNIAEYILK